MADENQTETVVELAKKAESNLPHAFVTDTDDRMFAITRNDFKMEQVTPANAAKVHMPKVVSGMVLTQTADSLADYINRFKNSDTVLFANMAENKILGVIDYHGQPPANVVGRPTAEGTSSDSKPDPRLCAHQVSFKLDFSEQWTTWNTYNNEMMSQMALSDFLEQNGVDIIEPVGADLLEIISDLDVYAKSTVKSRVRMGFAQNLSFAKDADVTGSKDGDMALPTKLKLRIPVYFGEGTVDIDALIRLVVDDGHASIGYKLVRPEQIRQIEFQRVVDSVMGTTGVTTIYGAPTAR